MKTALVLLGFLFHTGFVLFAQTMGLEEVRTLALANSRSLAKYNLAVTGTALDERSRIFSALPSLSLGANASMSLWNAQNAAPVDNPFDIFSSGANFNVSQKIFEGGKTLIKAHYGFLQSLSKLRSLGAFSDEEKLFSVLIRYE
jgi:hypothetical protein